MQAMHVRRPVCMPPVSLCTQARAQTAPPSGSRSTCCANPVISTLDPCTSHLRARVQCYSGHITGLPQLHQGPVCMCTLQAPQARVKTPIHSRGVRQMHGHRASSRMHDANRIHTPRDSRGTAAVQTWAPQMHRRGCANVTAVCAYVLVEWSAGVLENAMKVQECRVQ